LLNLWSYLTRPPAQYPLITAHRFQTVPGLFQCIALTDRNDSARNRCGRLENEHAP
jgi:hypothetical protein